MPKVYGVMLSPYVRKVMLALEAKGVAYENEAVFPGALPEGYTDVSPLGKIPALSDGDLNLSDSTVINEYIEERYPEPSLLPSSVEARAKARWLEEFADTALVSALSVPFFQRVVAPMRGAETDEAAIASAEAESIPAALDYVESVVSGAEFLFDGKLSVADIAMISPIINAEIGQYTIDASRWPKAAAYATFIRSQEVVQKREAEERAMLGG
ncbi:glutathione S-transferase family protein [Pseudoteredinibacter isoporae]|uniref:Glutathione S-transferase n=1 Tax=Pseudoteredinibacter isoporae TaxID=570281 RepID=A0A7X0JSJ5_9GAMM|nr:glutathione S-transferase family protein [Pseudoteredinibacter isoporae]MBB6520586.1 glutathione S-transferase [Pseudoteredinibacter isoporae]NHO86153.1 glutathione S-transferase family protein [Pseudoteredinibacter isoporae]NIB25396.1 glutathione S-transferase family protein [Pseudoteredinibacter isoporae]